MNSWIQDLVGTFVPIFIVVDAFGTLPFVILLSEGSTRQERNNMVKVAIATAALVGLIFLFIGRLILNLMGISVGAFAIAGGTVLLVLSVNFMTKGHMVEVNKEEMVAVVPIGTPLLAGPATITTLLLLESQYPLYIVLISFVLNLLLAWLFFLFSGQIVRFMGHGGVKALSKVFSLLLAAIAVDMMISGLDMLGLISRGT
jgi:multiple antibiotic resistance protein